MNLTSLLVLTTLFISISGTLPTTSYVKMIDIWLLANLFVPFAEVLLHTYMDMQRDQQEREVNKHGGSLKFGKDKRVGSVTMSRQDRVQKDRQRRLRIASMIASKGLPFGFILFVIVYFVVGISWSK